MSQGRSCPRERRAAQLPRGTHHQRYTGRRHPEPGLAELLHHTGHFPWRKWKAEGKRKGRWPRGAAAARDSAKTGGNADVTCCSRSAAKPWPPASPGCAKSFSVSRETSMGTVARIVKKKKKSKQLPCNSLKCRGRGAAVGCSPLQPHQFLLKLLAPLLVSKILWLPCIQNETGSSSETCDYSSFSLNNLVYWSVVLCSLAFWFLWWKRCAGFQFPHHTWCSAEGTCPPHPARDRPESCLCPSSIVFAYTSWKLKP